MLNHSILKCYIKRITLCHFLVYHDRDHILIHMIIILFFVHNKISNIYNPDMNYL